MDLNIDVKQLLQSLKSLQTIDTKQLLRRTDLLINIAIIAIALISMKIVYQKQTMQIKSLKTEIEEAEGTTDLIKEIEDNEKEMQSALKKLSIGKDFPDIIEVVTEIANVNGIEITTITQEQKNYSQQYYTLPLNLVLQGDYYDTWNFLRAIENSEEFFTIQTVGITGPEPSSRFRDDKKSSYCQVEVRLFATSVKKE